MDYQFENLGPERFQQFCQSLLAREFPQFQCFPIGQPDGGRDAIAFYLDERQGEFIVFQVKFARKPMTLDDPHKWLTDIVAEEAPKVKTLIPKGAREYYLITNVPGTAHLDTGSIDRVQRILNDTLDIPAHCWWRDDLSRRLDNAWDLKWAYPELMTGIDMLRHVVQSRLSEHRERRTTAIQAYIRLQYQNDREVRFKQIDLQNQLLDLFIDVPLTIRHNGLAGSKHQVQLFHIARTIAYDILKATGATRERRRPHAYEESLPGTASMLLHPMAQKYVSQVVLEGAPGQGKSTIVQYVCQIHRMKILGENQDLERIPAHHRATSVRVPFKVELRDLAAWLNRRDPFSPENHDKEPVGWHKSLDAFLAAQVRHLAGGHDFSVTDLHAVAKLSPLLLVLDGLDEVADIPTRREVVREVIAGITRLRESTKDLQVIITSRPAAFANSPGFPEDRFPYVELGAITRELIDEYANRWLRARRLHDRHGAEVKKILAEKLGQQHLSELARNPMQLAILLSLIHTRGSSLPDKRTALYDSYVELFFDREAEKSEIVREHRDLLIDIHRYLAWYLHSQAEKGNERGSISSDRLLELLERYLKLEGRDPSIAGELFTGMVERVVALVSRVEGTYEFEVQPLREYFAARHLYETAPYSPPGAEKRGTKPDRFDALARNFYWLNVTRFYAGCYSKGELPSLVDRLIELVEEEGYRNTSHPRRLAAVLLSDWVFAQHPKSMKKIVPIILDGLGLRYALNFGSRYRHSANQLVLPKGCGREELVQRCFEILQTNPVQDYAHQLIELIKANSVDKEIRDIWLGHTQSVLGDERTKWIHYGLYLELLPKLETTELESLMADAPYDKARLGPIFRARHTAFCEQDEQRCNAIIDAILDRAIVMPLHRQVSSVLDWFALALDPYRYAIAFQSPQPVPLSEMSRRYFPPPQPERESTLMTQGHSNPLLQKCAELIRVAESERARTAREWASELAPWENVVEQSRSLFGESWAYSLLANISSGIRSRDETCKDFPDLLDHSKSLCRRARYARLRAGNPKWWKRQLEQAETSLDQMFTCLVLLTWSSYRTLAQLSPLLGDILDSLPESNWHRLAYSLQHIIPFMELRKPRDVTVRLEGFPDNPSKRTVAAVAMRVTDEAASRLYRKHLRGYDGSDPFILEFCQNSAFNLLRADPSDWQHSLEIIEKSYAQGIVPEHSLWQLFGREGEDFLPLTIAQKIAENADKYPNYLVNLAEATCREAVAARTVPVAEIAQRDGWFDM